MEKTNTPLLKVNAPAPVSKRIVRIARALVPGAAPSTVTVVKVEELKVAVSAVVGLVDADSVPGAVFPPQLAVVAQLVEPALPVQV